VGKYIIGRRKMMFFLFVSESCQKCQEIKQKVDLSKVSGLRVCDVEEVEGLSAATYYGVTTIPTLIGVSEKDEDVVLIRVSGVEVIVPLLVHRMDKKD
jgi:hypothetical protein